MSDFYTLVDGVWIKVIGENRCDVKILLFKVFDKNWNGIIDSEEAKHINIKTMITLKSNVRKGKA